MKLNLGCGFNKFPGYVNVDKSALCEPDLCFDLEKSYPLEDNTASEIVLHHTLEHLGFHPDTFIFVMKELYRVSQNDCLWKITVPHCNTDVFHVDPTHVRKILPMTLKMFDQEDNVKDLKNHGHYTKLGLLNEIDIEVIKETFFLAEPWNSKISNRQISNEELNFAGSYYNNICSEIYIECRVYKPQRYSNDSIKSLYSRYFRTNI